MNLLPIYGWYRNLLRNPRYRAWVILLSMMYLFSPVDLLPDIVPGIGQIDDALVLTVLLSEVTQIATDRLRTTRRRKSTADPAGVATIDV